MREILSKSIESKGSELQEQVKNIVVWELRRYKVDPSVYPSIGLADKVVNANREECIARFTLRDGDRPFIVLSLGHPVVRSDTAQLLMSIFHEVHHFLNWKKDPPTYEKEKNLSGTHPIELQHERDALVDLHAFLKQLAETGML